MKKTVVKYILTSVVNLDVSVMVMETGDLLIIMDVYGEFILSVQLV